MATSPAWTASTGRQSSPQITCGSSPATALAIDSVDLAAAKERGIIVTNTPGANSVSVAELAVGMMLALARNLVTATQATKAGQWPRLNGVSLESKTIGILGFGSIGKNVAKRLCGFDCTILAYDPLLPEGPGEYGVQLVSQDEVIEQADFLTLHCPLTEAEPGHGQRLIFWPG